MMRGEKSVVGGAKKEETLGVKLRRGVLVGKRRGPSTPPPTWLQLESFDYIKANINNNSSSGNDGLLLLKSSAGATATSSVSARKLGANLWDLDILHHSPPHPQASLAQMSSGVKDKPLHHLTHVANSSNTPPHQPASASSLRRHIAASLIQHHKMIERGGRDIQPLSPASCSSMEIAAYDQVVTPTSSLDLRGRLGDSAFSLKTSTELLKVLNRIWSLEEQHTSNISLIKSLKKELDRARVRIQELVHEQQADRNEIDDLMKQVSEDSLVLKSKERDRIRAAVQSVRGELEDEKKLRKRSESIHRKLARELSEVKLAFSKGMKELERERKARVLLENLCDEFARCVGNYEQKLRALKHKSQNDFDDSHDQLILHIAEAWLDERMQTKLSKPESDPTTKGMAIDKLSGEIETLLEAKRLSESKNDDSIYRVGGYIRRHSLESAHLREAVSAPFRDFGNEDSVASDVNCFELNNNVDKNETKNSSKVHNGKSREDLLKEIRKSSPAKPKSISHEKTKGHNQVSVSVNFEEHMVVQGSHRTEREDEANHLEIGDQKVKSGDHEAEGSHDTKGRRDDAPRSNRAVDVLIRNQLLPSESARSHEDIDAKDESCGHFSWRGHSFISTKDKSFGDDFGISSPVRKWNYQSTSPDLEISKSSSKWPRNSKENSLKAKLLEASSQGKHARIRISKGL